MTAALTRRGVLGAAATSAATTVWGCGGGRGRVPPVALPPVAPQPKGSELLTLRRLLVLERLQHQRWAAAAALVTHEDGAASRRRHLFVAEVAVEAAHVAAVAELVHVLGGGRSDPFRPGPAPATVPAALTELVRIERAVAGAWQEAAMSFVALETRAAAISLLGVELRQVGVLAALRGHAATPVPPTPVTVDAALARIGADAVGPVPDA